MTLLAQTSLLKRFDAPFYDGNERSTRFWNESVAEMFFFSDKTLQSNSHNFVTDTFQKVISSTVETINVSTMCFD